jgi:hypothetical protein
VTRTTAHCLSWAVGNTKPRSIKQASRHGVNRLRRKLSSYEIISPFLYLRSTIDATSSIKISVYCVHKKRLGDDHIIAESREFTILEGKVNEGKCILLPIRTLFCNKCIYPDTHVDLYGPSPSQSPRRGSITLCFRMDIGRTFSNQLTNHRKKNGLPLVTKKDLAGIGIVTDVIEANLRLLDPAWITLIESLGALGKIAKNVSEAAILSYSPTLPCSNGLL